MSNQLLMSCTVRQDAVNFCDSCLTFLSPVHAQSAPGAGQHDGAVAGDVPQPGGAEAPGTRPAVPGPQVRVAIVHSLLWVVNVVNHSSLLSG